MKPGDFPLGSLESRAAARAMLEDAEGSRLRLTIVSYLQRPGRDNSQIHIGAWQACPDGLRMRMVYVPSGMDWPE
jgi:hypothetical protein